VFLLNLYVLANYNHQCVNFFYYRHKQNLHLSNHKWLKEMGLKETLWIIDGQWFLILSNGPIFKEWIGE